MKKMLTLLPTLVAFTTLGTTAIVANADTASNNSTTIQTTQALRAKVNSISANSQTVTGTAPKGSTVIIKNNDNKTIGTAKAGDNGKFTVKVNQTLTAKQSLKVTVIKNNQQQKLTSTVRTATTNNVNFFKNLVPAPRLNGTSYTNDNAGYKLSITAKKSSTLKYNIQTYNDDGSTSAKPFAIKLYKNGTFYKTVKSNNGSLRGSLLVKKGTYTVKVLALSSANHFTGGLTLA